MSNYKTLNEKEKNDFLSHKESRVYKYVGHHFVPLKGVGKNYCTNCGLMALNNDITRWCIDKGCFHDVHSGYKAAIRRFTKWD